ncbi:MAG: hypothetical protein ABIQ40_12050 [Bacteroidia bacterium]
MHNYDIPTSEYDSENSIPEMENDFENENLYENEDESNDYENENNSENELSEGESFEMEMADELLAVQGEDEMDHYLKRLFRRATGRRRSLDRKMTDALAILLKGLSKKLFTSKKRNRHRLSSRMMEQENTFRAEFLGQEFEGLNQEDQEFETRRSFVRLAGSAARRASVMHQRQSPRWRARRALALAARRHAPGIYNPAILNTLNQFPSSAQPSPALSQRLNMLENAIGSLTEKISYMKMQADNQPSNSQQATANDDAKTSDTEYESMYEDEWEEEDYEGDYENEDYESEDEEEDYEEMNNEYEDYEDNESEDYEHEDYEEQESGEYEQEENENEKQKSPGRRKRKCKCGSCKGVTANEFEENESEENESEENEYEQEENESEEYEYEYENDGEVYDRESTFNESIQMELASELLNVQTEEELDMFLGKLLKKAGRLVKKVSKIALPGPLGKVLKGIAKKVLPMAGGVLGGMFVPGLGNMIGKSVGDMASKAFEMEFEGLSQEDQEFEKAKAFVRFAGNAGMRSALLRRNLPPRARTKVALKHAAKRYAPGLLRRTPNRRNFRNTINARRQPIHNSAAYLRNQKIQQRRRSMNYRKNHPNRFTQQQRNLWRMRHPGQPFPQNGYSGRPYQQQQPYQGNQYPQQQPYQNGNYPSQQPNDFVPQNPGQLLSGGNAQDAPFSQKLSSLENALAQLTQKISSMNAPQASNGHDLPSGNDSGNDGGNDGSENEYWN